MRGYNAGFLYIIILGLNILFFLAASATASPPPQDDRYHIVDRLIVILFDHSIATVNNPVQSQRAIRYIEQILFSNELETLSGKDEIIINQDISIGPPLWRTCDAIKLISFGISNENLPRLRQHKKSDDFLTYFLQYFFHPRSIDFPMSEDNAVDYIRKNIPDIGNDAYYYDHCIARYALPFSMGQWQSVFPKELLILLVTEYNHESQSYLDGYRDLLSNYASSHMKMIASIEESFLELYNLTNLMQVLIDLRLKCTVIKLDHKYHPFIINTKLPRITTKDIVVDGDNKFIFPPMNVELHTRKAIFVPQHAILKALDENGAEIGRAFWRVPDEYRGRSSFRIPGNTIGINIKIDKPAIHAINIVTCGLYGQKNHELLHSPAITASASINIGPYISHLREIIILISGALLILILICISRRAGDMRIAVRHAGDVIEDDPSNIIRLPWKTGHRYDIEIVIKNTKLFSIGRRLLLWVVSENISSDTESLRWGYKNKPLQKILYKPGEKIKTGLLWSSRSYHLWINVDSNSVANPDTETTQFIFTIKEGRKGNSLRSITCSITRDLGDIWLAIDPGTNGSCVIAAEDPRDLCEIVLEKTTDRGDLKIMPSVVFIDDIKDVDQEIQMPITRYSNNTYCGINAERRMYDPIRRYYSAKRLVGYNEKRTITVQGKDVVVTGENAYSILIDYILRTSLDNCKPHFKNISRWNRMVIAVPNMFTPYKIRILEEILRKLDIIDIKHIYEGEAIALYYLSNHRRLNESSALSTGGKERILCIDFGGGTLDFSKVDISLTGRNFENTNIEILNREGYNLGGDIIDRIIAEIIWDKLSEVESGLAEYHNPFITERDSGISDTNQLNEWRIIRGLLKNQAENLKIALSNKFDKDNPDYDIYSTVLLSAIISKFKDSKTEISVSLKEILENEKMQDIINLYKDMLHSAIFDKYSKRDTIDVVICAGRSLHFPGFYKIVEKQFDLKTTKIIYLDLTEAKTAVAKGAAYFATTQDSTVLTKPKLLANYGVSTTKDGSEVFECLLRAYTSFNKEGKVKDSKKSLFLGKGNWFKLYQISSGVKNFHDILRDEKQKHRVSLIMKNKFNHTKLLNDFKITVNNRDEVYVDCITNDVSVHLNAKFNVEEYHIEDPFYNWLLI